MHYYRFYDWVSSETTFTVIQLSHDYHNFHDYQSHDYVGLIFFWSHDFHDFYDFYGSGPIFCQIERSKKEASFWPKIGHPQVRAYHFAPPGHIQPWQYNRL